MDLSGISIPCPTELALSSRLKPGNLGQMVAAERQMAISTNHIQQCQDDAVSFLYSYVNGQASLRKSTNDTTCTRGTCNQIMKIKKLRERKASFQRAELTQAREESLCSKYPLTGPPRMISTFSQRESIINPILPVTESTIPPNTPPLLTEL